MTDEAVDTNEWFDEMWDKLCKQENDTHEAKRHRYTGGRDPLENYLKTGEVITIATAGHSDRGALPAMLGRLMEKVNRAATMVGQEDFFDVNQGEEMNESLSDSFIDLVIISRLCNIEVRRLMARQVQTKAREPRC